MIEETKYKDIIEKVERLTVVELAELVHTLEEKFGVSAAAMAAAPAGGNAAAEEKDSYNVILKAAGGQSRKRSNRPRFEGSERLGGWSSESDKRRSEACRRGRN